MLTLAITPLNTLFKWRQTIPLRQWLGIYTFAYATIHFGIFIFLDYSLDLSVLVGAFLEKKFALAGFTAFLLMLPLALTSTKGWQKRLGRGWTQLHYLIYPAAIAAVVHFVWLTKQGVLQPWYFAILLTLLLSMRITPIRKWLSAQNWVPKIG